MEASREMRHCPDCGQGRFPDEDWCGCGIARPEAGWEPGAGPWPDLTPPPAEPTRILHGGADVLPGLVQGGTSAPPPLEPPSNTANSLMPEIDFTRPPPSPEPRVDRATRTAGLALSAAIALVALSAWLIGRWDAGISAPDGAEGAAAWSSWR